MWLGSEAAEEIIDLGLREVNELSAALGPQVVLYREVEGFESALFLSYFAPHGLEYLNVESLAAANFFHVRVSDCTRVKTLPYSSSYLSSYDVFVFRDEVQEEILIYADDDADASDFEAAMVLAGNLNRHFHKSSLRIQLVNSISDQVPRALSIGMNQTISLNYESALPQDASFVSILRLFRLDYFDMEDDGSAKFFECASHGSGTSVKGEVYDLMHLESSKVYVLIGGLSEDYRKRDLFVWVGRDVGPHLRDARLRIGHVFINNFRIPFASTIVQCVNQSFESAAFIECLGRVTDAKVAEEPSSTPASSTSVVGKLLTLADMARAVIPKGGKLKIWHAEHDDNRPCEMREYGHFYGNSCYVLVFDYPIGLSARAYVVFSWLGSIAEIRDRDNAMACAHNLYDNFGENSLMVLFLVTLVFTFVICTS